MHSPIEQDATRSPKHSMSFSAVATTIPLWAKSKGGRWHHALAHSLDTAAVFWALGERDSAIKCRLAKAFGLPEDVALATAALIAGCHDQGKLTPSFQASDSTVSAKLRSLHFPFPVIVQGVSFPHGTATARCLAPILVQCGWSPELGQLVADIAGGHHGIIPTAHDRQTLSARTLGHGVWASVREAYFHVLRSVLQLQNAPIPAATSLSPADATLLAGLISVADWIASNEGWFPYTDQLVDPYAHFAHSLRRAQKVLESIGWEVWRPAARQRFRDACDVVPNSLQEVVEQIAEQIDEPTLVVLEAPPGHGKTEAGEYLALRLVSRLGHRGFYFALPTQATANQMLGRVQKFLTTNSDMSRVVLQLLHGNALLHGEFEELLQRGSAPSLRDEPDDTAVVATEWFTGPKRGLLAPIGVGTIDQILLAALRTKHVFVRQMALANKVVIVDEVHAYDPYMLGLLERLVEWLAALGSSVILMSATLPTERRARLIDAYNRGRGVPTRVRRGGPSGSAVTWATRSGAESIRFEPNRRAPIGVRWIDGRLSDKRGGCPLGKALERKLANGGCAVVVCNTVGRAQDVYRTLRARWCSGSNSDIELILFHALLPYEDRARIESEIVRKFGPNGDRPSRAVVVATQVIEQSLDVDFDLVVSDMAPIDLLIQRAGRGHRHSRSNRPIPSAELWIIAPVLSSAGLPVFDPRDAAIYHEHVLLRTWHVLQAPCNLADPICAADLIEAVYASDIRPPEGSVAFQAAWDSTAAAMRQAIDEFETKARERRTPSPVDSELRIADLTRAAMEEGGAEAEASLSAETRLGAVRVPVVLAYATAHGPALDPEGRELIHPDRYPTAEETRRLLDRSVSISHQRIAHQLLEMTSPAGWRKHPWLLRHRLVVLEQMTDGAWAHRFGSGKMSFDPELGVVIR